MLYDHPVCLMRRYTAIGHSHTAGLWPVTLPPLLAIYLSLSIGGRFVGEVVPKRPFYSFSESELLSVATRESSSDEQSVSSCVIGRAFRT
jgi:hypothetical protein